MYPFKIHVSDSEYLLNHSLHSYTTHYKGLVCLQNSQHVYHVCNRYIYPCCAIVWQTGRCKLNFLPCVFSWVFGFRLKDSSWSRQPMQCWPIFPLFFCQWLYGLWFTLVHLFVLMYMSICLQVCMCVMCMQYLWRPEEGLRSRTGVQIVVSHPGMQTQVLCKSPKCL